MKKTLLFSTLTFVVVTLSSFKHSSSVIFPKTNSLNEIYQQQQTVDAYIMWGSNWRRGQITYSSTQQGYKPISYQFEDYGNSQLRGQFFPDQRFSPLNPNNQLAKQNNWTHTISVQGVTAYLTIY
jgi:hypothetical protein